MSAKVSCKLLIDRLPSEPFSDELTGQYGYKHFSGHLIFPIVYSIKHGIELYLKGIGNTWDGVYENDHDLVSLLDSLEQKFKCDQRVNGSGILEAITKLRPFVVKYYNGQYLPGAGNSTRPDKKNDAERYPETNAYLLPDITPGSQSVLRVEDVQVITNDITVVWELLRKEIWAKSEAIK